MINSRASLITALKNYRTSFAEEERFATDFLQLLEHPDAFQRTHLPGHITGSSWIINESGDAVLLTHHAKLNRWLQPGGHADGDENVLRVALREATEETGLNNLVLINNGLFDIDIHEIPARKDFPAHLHYDIRFLFQAKTTEALIITEESTDLAWKTLKEVESMVSDNDSILRMIRKTK